MTTFTNKSKFILLFTAAAVFVPKKALSQTEVTVLELDTPKSANESEVSSTPEPDNLHAPISEPEFLDSLLEFDSKPHEFVPYSQHQIKVVDLPKNPNSQLYDSKNINQAEFTKLANLEQQNSNSQISTSAKQINEQVSISELETKQASPPSHPPKKLSLDSEIKPESAAEKSEETSVDPNYIIPPRIAPNQKVNPFSTTLPLNGIPISHLTEWEIIGGVTFSDEQNETFNINGIVKLNSQIQESLTKDNIYTVEQTGSYFQIQSVRQSREVTTIKTEPQTLLGTEIQLSLIASCTFPGSNSEDLCTYTPGIATDRNSIDPDSLLPTRVLQSSQVGDVVTPESLEAIKQPGFQRGANDQEIGVDLFFPNAGSIPGNTLSDKTSVTRKEKIENTPVGMYSTVRQVVRANDREAVIGRTIRGFGFIVNDENALLNSALQLGNFFLPDADPPIEGGTNPVNANINKNLFFAANNARLPANSFTFYHAGIGRAKSPQLPITNLNQVPSASFNSIWVGVSPVIKRRLSSRNRYEPTGSPIVLFSDGAEGGVNSNVDFLSIINDQRFSTANLNDFYAQVYLKTFNQDANYVTTSKFTEETSYAPHISFTGDITGSQDVFRYYAGVIAAEEVKAYVGGDYTKNTLSGWTYSAGAIGYINPDRDYYSQVQGSISKRIPFSQTANLFLSTGFNYALDQDNQIDDFTTDSTGSSLSLGARANIGSVSVGLVNYFGDILPNSIENTLLADMEIKFNDNFRLSAYYTPINDSSSRSRYGAKAQFKLGNRYNSPTLMVSWTNNEYDFGSDKSGNELQTTDNVFTVMLKLGKPANPLNSETAQRLQRQVDDEVEQLKSGREKEGLNNNLNR